MTRRFCALLSLLLVVLSARVAWGSRAEERALLDASGVPKSQLETRLATVDRLAEEFRRREATVSDGFSRIERLHAYLHGRVLTGPYQASASNVGTALDGGPFNCVAATLLLRMLCDRCDIPATAMSTRGHVWCRVLIESNAPLDIESTCEEWFAIRAKYLGVPTSRVSPAMATHRKRTQAGRELTDRELLAVLCFNRGVSCIQQVRLAEAALANLQAVTLDSSCQPAWENLAAVRRNLPANGGQSLGTFTRLIFWAIDQAVRSRQPSLAAN